MTGWRQAVFIRQRRIDVIQRALSKILDDETWSPATPRRLHIGAADASSRGWTMIVPALASFFLDRGGAPTLRLCRLASELRCPVFEVDVRDAASTTLIEVDPTGRLRVSGSATVFPAGAAERSSDDGIAPVPGQDLVSDVVTFKLLAIPEAVRDRIAALHGAPAMALADYLGALAGFPAWTHHDDDAIMAGAMVYEPPKIIARATSRASRRPHATTSLAARPLEPRESLGRVVPAHDRRSRRPRSAARPRR